MFAVNNIMPTRENIANRTYPLITEVYVVTRKNIEASTQAARLREWLITDEGQKKIEETGYVPINVGK